MTPPTDSAVLEGIAARFNFQHHNLRISGLCKECREKGAVGWHNCEDNCPEVLAVRGAGSRIKKLADRLTRLKGVKHDQLAATSTGRHLK